MAASRAWKRWTITPSEFTLQEPNAAFLGSLTSNYKAIVDKGCHRGERRPDACDGGTGPFMLGEWIPTTHGAAQV